MKRLFISLAAGIGLILMTGSCEEELVTIGDSLVGEEPFTSGKVFYDLAKHRDENEIDNAAIIRIEQLYPLNEEMLELMLSQFPKATKWVWAQEEPRNMGAYSYIRPRLESILDARIRYAGRKSSSSPAAGSKGQHIREQQMLVEEAFEN